MLLSQKAPRIAIELRPGVSPRCARTSVLACHIRPLSPNVGPIICRTRTPQRIARTSTHQQSGRKMRAHSPNLRPHNPQRIIFRDFRPEGPRPNHTSARTPAADRRGPRLLNHGAPDLQLHGRTRLTFVAPASPVFTKTLTSATSGCLDRFVVKTAASPAPGLPTPPSVYQHDLKLNLGAKMKGGRIEAGPSGRDGSGSGDVSGIWSCRYYCGNRAQSGAYRAASS